MTDATNKPKSGDLYKQHNHVCVLVSEFSECLKHIQLVDFVVGLPMTCVMFYFLLIKKESAQGDSCHLMATSFTQQIAFCWAGSKNNLKLIMFTTRLEGPPIGYSEYDLITSTVPTSRAIASTLLTYFVVVIQLKKSGRET